MVKAAIGIDIGNFNVKVAQIKQRHFSKERHLSFAIKEIGREKSRESIIQSIKDACRDAKIESSKVEISIYGPEVIMKYITLPCLKFKELSRCLTFELERYIFSKKINDMIIDYRILYKLSDNLMAVLLIAVERQKIEEQVNLIKDAGLEVNAINIDALALKDAFLLTQSRAGNNQITAVLDIGYSISKLVVFADDVLYFSRDINSGIYDLAQIVSDKMGIDFSLMNKLEYNSEDKEMEKFYTAVKANLNDLADELRLSFEYCSRYLQKKVDRLYLSGGGSKLEIIRDTLTASLNFKEAGVLDVTGGFELFPNITQEELKRCSPLLTVAVGLAAAYIHK